jgi:hypothetical protein
VVVVEVDVVVVVGGVVVVVVGVVVVVVPEEGPGPVLITRLNLEPAGTANGLTVLPKRTSAMTPDATRVLAMDVAHVALICSVFNFAVAAAQVSPINDVGNVSDAGPFDMSTVMASPVFALVPCAGDWETIWPLGTVVELTCVTVSTNPSPFSFADA